MQPEQENAFTGAENINKGDKKINITKKNRLNCTICHAKKIETLSFNAGGA